MSEKIILECPDDPVLQEDMDRIGSEFPFAGDMSGATVLVTGSTGLIGSQVVFALCAMNRLRDTNIRVLAMVRSVEKAREVFGELIDRGDIALVTGDITEPASIDGNIDYIVHTASPTGSRYFVDHPVETIDIALKGTKNMLELSLEKKVKAMVYLSSLEVYGTPDRDQEWMTETDFGRIDPAKTRSSYSEGKRMAECMCVSYASEYSVPVRIARLSQTFGPGVRYDDNRVFMDFSRSAIEQRDILMHTQGRTVRTYLYTADAVMAILYLLARGENGQAYNVTNPGTAISILNMARLVCKTIGNKKIQVMIDAEEDEGKFGYNPEMVIRLDPSKLEALGWRATTDLETMYDRMTRKWRPTK